MEGLVKTEVYIYTHTHTSNVYIYLFFLSGEESLILL